MLKQKQRAMTTSNDTTYTSISISVKGHDYMVLRASGKHNYVTVKKTSSNPFGTLGKEFATEDEAIKNYKSIAMKAALVQAFAQI